MCDFRGGSNCAIAAGLARLPAIEIASDAACAACKRCPRPQARNKVTLNLAYAALRAAGREAEAWPLLAAAAQEAGAVAPLPESRGVGAQLWRLAKSLGISFRSVAACLPLRKELDRLHPAACRRERTRLVAQLGAHAAEHWIAPEETAAAALARGLPWRLDLRDLYGSLLDEAIRRAEAAGATGVARPTLLAVPEAATASDSSGTANAVGRATPAPQRLILRCNLCPGDLLTLSAAIESLHLTYPGEYLTDVRTRHPAIWAHNPRITPLRESAGGVRSIQCHYPSINRCNQESIPFLGGYTEHLGSELGRPLRLRVNRPQLHLSAEEAARPLAGLWKSAPNFDRLSGGKPIWLIDAGVKRDYTIKGWPVEYFQEVVDRTSDRICWVQIGLRKDLHPELRGVVSLLDTGPPMRETILLAYHAAGGLGPVTFFQHLLAAWQRPYICLVGGREPSTWVQYPLQHTLHTVGSHTCCRDRSCWKARVVPFGDGSDKDKSLCKLPVTEDLERPAARCMVDIAPIEVLALLDRLANGRAVAPR